MKQHPAERSGESEARRWKARYDEHVAAVAALADAASGSYHGCATADDLHALLANPAAVLADRDRRMKAEGWAEGYIAAMNNAYRNPATGNPYREGGRADD